MTHTLHRKSEIPLEKQDFTILCMACQGYNDLGAADKLRQIYRLVAENDPDNLADDNLGGRLTGHTDQEVLDHMGDKAYVGAAFSNRQRLAATLSRIKEADLGMSVVVTGDYSAVFKMLREVGLRPHTVNMSLGVFGKTAILPEKEVLSISTMCGHGMVPCRRIREAVEQVRSGSQTEEKAGVELAATCTCGIFNPVVATAILKRAATFTPES